MSPVHVDVIVLAGGRSRRMLGQDKLAAPVGGAPIVARVVAACAASPATQQLIVAAGPDADSVARRSTQLSSLPPAMRARVRLVVDDPSLDGPVAGLAAALAAAAAPIVMVVAGDMPFVTADAIDKLVRVLQDADADEAWLAMAVDAEGHHQFACCAWRRERLSALLDLERSSGRTERGIALKALVKRAEARGLARLVELGDTTALLDVDDPSDLQRAQTLAATRR